MNEEWWSRFSLPALFEAVKTRLGSAILTITVHALILFGIFYVAKQDGTPGIETPSTNVFTLDLGAPQPDVPQPPKFIEPEQPQITPPVFTIIDRATYAAVPVITASNATPGQSEYLLRLWRFALRYMVFPRNALISGEGGVVLVHVVIDREGNAVLVEIDTSSGNQELDAAALNVIKRAQPLPIFPENLGLEYFSTVMRFGYGPSGVQGRMDAFKTQ
jgi:TonB family protein